MGPKDTLQQTDDSFRVDLGFGQQCWVSSSSPLNQKGIMDPKERALSNKKWKNRGS